MKNKSSLKILVVSILTLSMFLGCVGEDETGLKPYQDPNLPVEGRVKDLLKRMTLDEKIGQMWQASPDLVRTYNNFDEEKARKLVIGYGVGSFLSIAGEDTQKLQKIAVEETRLGIPILFGIDAIHGHALYNGSTIFPMPLALSSSWNPGLIEKTASATAKEVASTGVKWTFSPILDVARDPRWGRIIEGFGEDPYLVSQLGAAKVRGYQGSDLSSQDSILACGKHLAAYSETTGGRDYSPADISERTLMEMFLPPFKEAVNVGVGSIMTSFNEINGVPSTANTDLVRNILKDEWEFDGLVVSDYASVRMLYDTHYVAEDLEDAARCAVEAGVDMEMVSEAYMEHLERLVIDGVVPEKLIDDATGRILKTKFLLGLFENPYGSLDPSVINSRQHRNLALEAAEQSIVLLKNEGILPLKDARSIAVIGPLADDPSNQLGGWTGDQPAENVVTVLDGIKNNAPQRTKVRYSKGCDVLGEFDNIKKATRIARRSDVAIVVVGELENMSSEPNCRVSLNLPGNQGELVRAIHHTGTPVVVVLINGRPLTINWIAENIPAVVEAWFPGQEGGNAVAELLFGKINPSGKLTMTFPKSVGQIPLHYNHYPQKNWDHGKYGKRYVDIEDEPLFPFGYGLSYTKFDYGNLKIIPSKIDKKGEIRISLDVKNVGKIRGDETVQLYLNDVVSSVTTPSKELKGFKKITLNSGEKKNVKFTLTPNELSLVDRSMEWVVEPGIFEVMIGSSSEDLRLKGSFEIIE